MPNMIFHIRWGELMHMLHSEGKIEWRNASDEWRVWKKMRDLIQSGRVVKQERGLYSFLHPTDLFDF